MSSFEAQAEAHDHAAVVVDHYSQPGLPDRSGVDTDDDPQWTMVNLDALQDPGRQMLGRGGRMATIGDFSAPAFTVHLPWVELANATCNGPSQRGLARDGNRLRRR